MNTYNKTYGKILETNDYGKFKLINGNRVIDTSKVRRLIESMKEKQLVIPIIVNEKFEIIDGQHRFMACKELKYPVYYITIKGYGIEDVKRSNLISSTWDSSAFLNLYCSKGLDEYITLQHFVQEYKVAISVILGLKAELSDSSTRKEEREFRAGNFKFEDTEARILEFLESLSLFENYKYKRNTSFLKAYFTLFNRPEFDEKIMISQYKKLSYKLIEQFDRTKDGFLDVLVNRIYSYRPAAKNKLTYDRGTNSFYTREK